MGCFGIMLSERYGCNGPLWFGSSVSVRKTETVVPHRGSSALTDLKLAGKQSVAVRVTFSSKFYYL